jgi:hypothetical protein
VLFLPPAVGLGRGRPVFWAWQLVALLGAVCGLGFEGGSGLLAIAPALVVLVYWIKPEVRRYCRDAQKES